MASYLQELTEGRIDFVGQQLVNQIAHVVLIAATIISFVVGFALQSLSITFALFGGATAVLLLITVPPWPMYNRYPVKWLPVATVKKDEGKGAKDT